MRFGFIKRVGVELEGGWLGPWWHKTPTKGLSPTPGVPWNADRKSDGSVRVSVRDGISDNYVRDANELSYEDGRELCTETPVPPGIIGRWVKHNHPHFVNASCGMHVHVSFANLAIYERLMDESFKNYFIERLTQWGLDNNIPRDGSKGHFWSRMEGDNSYCRKTFDPQRQINPRLLKTNANDIIGRYYQLNFYAWHRHKTLEVRVLPVFKEVNLSVSAVKTVLMIIESYLRQTNKQHIGYRKEKKTVILSEPEFTSLTENKELVLQISDRDSVVVFKLQEEDTSIDDVVVRTTRDIHPPVRF